MSRHARTDGVLVERVRGLLPGRSTPLLVALDGRSGAGKSTLAARLTAALDAAVVDGDDFYAGGTAQEWDAMTPAEAAARCVDWRRQRTVLDALAHGEQAAWHPYDWEADDGRLRPEVASCEPRPVVVLEGCYSARPELAGLVGLRVLLDVPRRVARERLRRREGDGFRGDWEARWERAEEHYLSAVMPPEAFDLVLRGASVHPPDA